jgi:predicted dehydrogenase
MGYEMRINPAVCRIREIVASGAIGEIRAFSFQQYRPAFRRDKWQQWIQEKKRSGGLIVEETCHWFDLARYITGNEVESVHCVADGGVHADFDFEDIAFVQGTFNDGSILQIGHSLTGFDFSIIMQVHGSLGTVWCGMKAASESVLDAGQTSYHAVVASGPANPGGSAPHVETFAEEALEAQNIRDHVAECVEKLVAGAPFRSNLNDGLESLRIALAASRSAESGRVEAV